MSFKQSFSKPQDTVGTQFEPSRAKEADPGTVPEVASPGATIISFAFYLIGKDYHAVALKTQGDKVLEKKVLAVDDFKRIALDAADKASFGLWNHGEDPFMKPNKGE